MNPVLSSVFSKTLYDRRRGLAGWSAGVVVATLLILALWPTVRDMDDLEQLVAGYPEELRELFGIETLATPAGFLNG